MDALTLFADSVYQQIFEFVAAITAIGLIVMALIQSFKDMFPLRRMFHRRFVHAWLRHKAGDHAKRAGRAPDAGEALEDLIELATTGDERALFDLPIEQLCGQAAAAASQSLDYPNRHEPLLRCLAASADPDDLDLVMRAPQQERSEVEAEGGTMRMALVDARTRVMHQVQRSIDALQIAAGYRWKWYLQLLAFSLSYVLTVIAVLVAESADPIGTRLLMAIPLGLIGGFVAPVTRDLVATWTKR